MEPLFLAAICGCRAGLFREALHDIYIPRIQRGNASFAANVLGARGAVLAVLAHFFEPGRWGSFAEMGVEGQSLTAEDHLYILMQSALYLTVTRGFAAPEARTCYERVESLCHSLNRPLLLYSALISQWRYTLWTDKLSVTKQIADRVYALAQEQNDARVMMGAYRVLASTLYFLGDFETVRQYAVRGLEIWRSGSVQCQVEEVSAPAVNCLCFKALTEWHFGEIDSCKATMAEAIPLAKELNDMPALAVALFFATHLAHFEGDSAEVERLALDLIELSTRQNFVIWLPIGAVFRGWARSISSDANEGISWIERGIGDYRATGSIVNGSYFLALKAEALHLSNRTAEALEAISEAEALVERSEERFWCAELHRLRGVFLAALGVDETQIEASLCAAVRTAREQKSVSLAKRAEATYAEYRRQKTSAGGGRGFRLPLC
jgi:adenylate cyclase